MTWPNESGGPERLRWGHGLAAGTWVQRRKLEFIQIHVAWKSSKPWSLLTGMKSTCCRFSGPFQAASLLPNWKGKYIRKLSFCWIGKAIIWEKRASTMMIDDLPGDWSIHPFAQSWHWIRILLHQCLGVEQISSEFALNLSFVYGNISQPCSLFLCSAGFGLNHHRLPVLGKRPWEAESSLD